MSKGDTTVAKNLTRANLAGIQAQGGAQNTQLQNLLAGQQGQAAQDYSTAAAGYGNFAQTGGLSPSDISTLQSSATQGVGDVYQSLEDEASRRAATTGQSAAADIAQLGRQAGEAESNALTNVNAQLAGMIQGGKEFGVAGQGGLYGMDVQQMETTVNQILQNFEATGQLSNADLAILQKIGAQPGVGSNILNTIATLAPGGLPIFH
jgi:hypothetical protein